MTELTVDGQQAKSSGLAKPVKLMLVLLLLIVVAFGLFLLTSTKGISKAGTLIDSNVTLDSTGSVTAEELTPPEYIYPALSPANQELIASIPGLVNGNSQLTELLSSLQNTIDELNRKLVGYSTEMKSTFHGVEIGYNKLIVESADSQTQLSTLQQKVELLDKSISTIKNRQAINRKSVTKPIVKKKSIPPFQLISVLSWDSAPVAIVSHEKIELSIGVKEKLAGWTIDNIMESGCMEVSLQDEKVKLCL